VALLANEAYSSIELRIEVSGLYKSMIIVFAVRQTKWWFKRRLLRRS
jgi:hypothetical protein